MIRLLFVLLLLAFPAWGQTQLTIGQTSIFNGVATDCLTVDANKRLGQQPCTTGNVTTSGSLVNNNVVVGASASVIKDSGVQIKTTLCAGCFWGNNLSSTSPPNEYAIINMASDSVGAPAYSWVGFTTSGMRANGGAPRLVNAGKDVLEIGPGGSAGNYWSVSANDGPILGGAGPGANISAAIASKGTGASSPVNLLNNSGTGSQILASFTGGTTAANYPLTNAPNSGDVTVTMTGSGTDIGYSIVTKGAGVVTARGLTVASGTVFKLGNAYVNTPSVSTGYVLITDSAGTVYEIPAKAH